MGELTVAKLNRLTEPGRYLDGDGLYFFVRQTGSRSWVLRIAVRGRRVDIGLGSYPEIGLADARQEAGRLRTIAKRGDDPLAERRRKTMTVETAVAEFYKTIAPTITSERHEKQWLASFDNDVFPKIGKRPLAEITNADILRVLTPPWTKKNSAARKLKQRLQGLFDWAYHAGHYDKANPVSGIERALPKVSNPVQHREAIDWREAPKFYQAIEGDGITQQLFRFIILTAVRSSEAREAEWAEFDFDALIWTIPKERMKMGREHRVPITNEMAALLGRTKGLSERYVFPSLRLRGKAPLSANAIIQAYGGNGWTIHGFRSTFRDWAVDHEDVAREVAEASLAHVIGDRTERAYARTDHFEKRRKLMSSWSAYLMSPPT